jgi:hypothetical protein
VYPLDFFGQMKEPPFPYAVSAVRQAVRRCSSRKALRAACVHDDDAIVVD